MSGPPDYVVVRASLDLPDGWMPTGLDGRWYDRSEMPQATEAADPRPRHATAVPTGRLEVRDDGAVAEVWELRPW